MANGMWKWAVAVMVACTAGAALAGGTADGVVRKVDASAGRVIIKHGAFTGIDMGPMTMAFVVRDKSILTRVKPEDAVRIAVEKDGGEWVITRLDRAAGVAEAGQRDR